MKDVQKSLKDFAGFDFDFERLGVFESSIEHFFIAGYLEKLKNLPHRFEFL